MGESEEARRRRPGRKRTGTAGRRVRWGARVGCSAPQHVVVAGLALGRFVPV